ncbi:pilus assembly protein PilY, partial [Acinetobacter sp. ANC 4639]
MSKLYQKMLTFTVSAFVSCMVCQSVSVQASDIDIYANATGGKTTLFLMFDTSGSMGYGDNYGSSANNASSLVQDYGVCSWSGGSSNVKLETKSYSISGGTQQSYSVNYCDVSSNTYNSLNSTYKTRIANECPSTGTNTYRCYDRLSRLKIAMVSILSGTQIPDTTSIGLGQFSSPTNTSAYSQDSVSGRVIYPVVPLTATNRQSLISAVTALQAYNGTPSAAAYGEAGAYMLGVNTSGLTNSGYAYSVSNSKNGNNGYIPPLSSSDLSNTCNGQGIYFLTDGVPNGSNTTATTNIMKKSVGSLTGTGLSGGTSDAGWTQIGQFSKLLRNNYNIKTAIVGFGSDFPNGPTYVKDLPVTIGSTTMTRRFYDCSQLPTGDVQNTCNWGAKPHNSLPSSVGGFGNGGFYSAQSTQDVIDSIKYFVDDVTPTFSSVTTGSPTLPQDAL